MRLPLDTTWLALLAPLGAACTQADAQDAEADLDPATSDGDFAIRASPLEAGARTIPYGGFVEFDGQPVEADSVDFNFALFPCATPGPGPTQCQPVWVAKGTWNEAAADWMQGWPTGASTTVPLSILAGRFTIELGASGQNPLPDPVESGETDLYLGLQIEGRALSTLQKLVTARRAVNSIEAAQGLPEADFLVHEDVVVGGAVVDAAGVRLTIPIGAVLPFDLDECPPGWSEYGPARGRFVRGVDRSGSDIDPQGEREVGSVQADELKDHTHQYTYMKGDNSVDGVDSVTTGSGEHHNEQGQTGATGGPETRPKNVALLYCRKD